VLDDSPAKTEKTRSKGQEPSAPKYKPENRSFCRDRRAGDKNCPTDLSKPSVEPRIHLSKSTQSAKRGQTKRHARRLAKGMTGLWPVMPA